MENLSIQEIWKQNEMLLENSRKFNLTLLREVKLDKVKSSLKGLLFLPVSTMVFFIITASYAMYFTAENQGTWYFILSGAVVFFFSVMFVVSSIRQLKHILSVNYNSPVLQLQKNISRIKVLVVFNFKIGALLLPFGPFIGLFIMKALFHIDMVKLINYKMIISFGVITVVLEVLSLVILRALNLKNMNKKWMNWLLQGSGSQIDEALGFLNQIEEFAVEEENDWCCNDH